MYLLINIYEIIYNTLTPLGCEVKEEGSYEPNAVLPDTYITYFIVDSPNTGYADNLPTGYEPRIQLKINTTDPEIKQNADILFRSVMLPVGFTRVGGRDLPFDSDTGHYSYTCDYRLYIQE